MLHELIIAGFGGQGVLSMGQLLAYAGMLENKEVSWIPAYGPEMRGGTANCGVTISDEPISSPMVAEPSTAIIMNRPSLDKFEKAVQPNGILIINSSLVDKQVQREDVQAYVIPANDMAEAIGNGKVANIVLLGAFLELTKAVSVEAVLESLKKVLPPHRHNLIPVNQAALEKGAEAIRNYGQ